MKKAVKKKLQERNAKYTLASPATLQGKNISFSSAKAAEKFFNEESREENEQGEGTPHSTD